MNPEIPVLFEPLHKDTELPTQATENSSCYDVYAYLAGRQITVVTRTELGAIANDDGVIKSLQRVVRSDYLEIYPGETVIIPLGFKMTLPANMEAQMRARSSWALSRGLVVPNAPGTIDADYTGEVGIILRNISEFVQYIRHGDRCGQMGFHTFERVEFIIGRVEQTTSRVGGYGSTGT